MKRFIIVLALLNFAAMGWSQNFKKKNIQAVPHGALKPIDMPELGVPIATQPLVGNSAIKTQPFLQKRSALLPQGLKVKTSDAGLPTSGCVAIGTPNSGISIGLSTPCGTA